MKNIFPLFFVLFVSCTFKTNSCYNIETGFDYEEVVFTQTPFSKIIKLYGDASIQVEGSEGNLVKYVCYTDGKYILKFNSNVMSAGYVNGVQIINIMLNSYSSCSPSRRNITLHLNNNVIGVGTKRDTVDRYLMVNGKMRPYEGITYFLTESKEGYDKSIFLNVFFDDYENVKEFSIYKIISS